MYTQVFNTEQHNITRIILLFSNNDVSYCLPGNYSEKNIQKWMVITKSGRSWTKP